MNENIYRSVKSFIQNYDGDIPSKFNYIEEKAEYSLVLSSFTDLEERKDPAKYFRLPTKRV